MVVTREEILSNEESLMEEEERDRYLEDHRDMEVVTDQDMIVPMVILPLFEDLTPEADQNLEEETDFVEIDRAHPTGLRISPNVLDVGVMLVRK